MGDRGSLSVHRRTAFGSPGDKVTFSGPPAVRGLTSSARFTVIEAAHNGRQATLVLDAYRRGRYVLAVISFSAVGSGAKATFTTNRSLQATADKAAGAKLVRAMPNP